MAHILVVEDYAPQRLAYERFLREAGHTMCWAATADGAIKLLLTEPIDIVLLDYILDNGLTGLDVARHIPRRIPVLIVSGYTREEMRRRAADPLAGMNPQYFNKPVDMGELLQAIKTSVAGWRGW